MGRSVGVEGRRSGVDASHPVDEERVPESEDQRKEESVEGGGPVRDVVRPPGGADAQHLAHPQHLTTGRLG